MSEVKLITKIQTFEDVQKSLQDIEKVLNGLTEAVNSKADKEAKDPEGKPGDLKMTRNFNESNDLEGKTEEGWVKLATADKFDTGWFTATEDTVAWFRHNIEMSPGDLITCDLFVKSNSTGMIVHVNGGHHPWGDKADVTTNNDNITTSFTSTHVGFSIDGDATDNGILFLPPPTGDLDSFGSSDDSGGFITAGGQ
tara:strand:- start:135 stop:722 length:588 start_codon:yes stop_codon:yes gene_type:complete